MTGVGMGTVRASSVFDIASVKVVVPFWFTTTRPPQHGRTSWHPLARAATNIAGHYRTLGRVQYADDDTLLLGQPLRITR